ncbi:exopolysaccharide biosynthesis protein [Bremerella sp. T1]|uniref:exopolysaccharide biosynthesis protein n=1 Tax=Bremerella sp. TYQ1 TaxID=3119568 RepID=UPI001CCB1025|nr:exopolysaccharide biosynthesis protein [Bremerella volcania]UBM35006.1 exopolysaccharide biosynthesis protein [Bremerella volcania]
MSTATSDDQRNESQSSEKDESSQQKDKPEGLVDILEQMKENTDGDEVTIDDTLDALNSRSFGPLLLVPAIMAVSPIGAIPGMSIVTGCVLMLIAVQMVFSDGHPWLPKRLLEFSFSRETMTEGIDKSLPWAKWLEGFTESRLQFLTQAPFHYVIAFVIAFLASLFVPLAFLPFAVAIPGTAIALFALGMTVRDGVMVLLGFAVSCAAVAVAVYFWPF